MKHKYSEQLFRHAALNSEGKPCEILERVTFEHREDEQGAVGQPVEVNRRFDLRTGERLVRVSENEFADDESGERVVLKG